MNQEKSKSSIHENNVLDLPNNNGINDEYESSRRTLILSSGDVESMAIASSKARLMLDLVRNPDESSSREFGFNYRGRKSDNNPVHITSSIPVTKSVVSTYPSLVQNIRWSPSIEMYCDESEPEMEEDQFHCRCHKCKMDRCQSRDNRRFTFKDNIMRFTDNSTMTPQLVDSSCEACTPLSRTPRISEVNISTSDTDIRESYSPTYPIPILKNPYREDYDTCSYRTEMRPHQNVNLHEEAIRDCHKSKDYENLLKSVPKRECSDEPNARDKARNDKSFRRSVYNDGSESCKKNIYNEGISDSIAETTFPRYLGCPVLQTPMKYPIRKNLSLFHGLNRQLQRKVNHSRLNDKYFSETPNKDPGIPFSYRIQSKYHRDCKEPVKKGNFRYDDNFCHGLFESDGTQGTIQSNRVLLCDRQTAKFPKKVLTSERDIDAFVRNRRMDMKASKFQQFSSC